MSDPIGYVVIFAVVALGVYRLADMITREDGPFKIFKYLQARFPITSSRYKLFTCPMCMSVYMSVLGAILLPYYGIAWYIATVFALSAITSILLRRYG